jgi:hypothetical protein
MQYLVTAKVELNLQGHNPGYIALPGYQLDVLSNLGVTEFTLYDSTWFFLGVGSILDYSFEDLVGSGRLQLLPDIGGEIIPRRSRFERMSLTSSV